MKLIQYASKLSKMSPAEISFRARQMLRNRREVRRLGDLDIRTNPQLFEPGWIQSWDYQSGRFPDTSIKFFGLVEEPAALKEIYQREFPRQAVPALEQAERLINHEFELLGLKVYLEGRISWNRNPETGADYPLRHHSQVDMFNTERYGDVKFAWELNRHQFFIEVAKAYLVSGDERYPQKIWQWLKSWIEDAPYKIGINNTSVLEHSVRIFSWVWAYYFTRTSPVWTEERLQTLTRQLLLHGAIIEENLSFYYSPYNHLIGELAALSFLGVVMGGRGRTAKWRDHYWKILEEQLDHQFAPDGFTVEQASYYHHFTLGFYLTTALLRKQNDLPVSPRTWGRLEQAIEFPMHLTRPDGRLPMLGDIDSARSVYFYLPEPQWDLRCFQALGAVLFGRGDMKCVSQGPAEELLWLLGPAGVEQYRQLAVAPPEAASIKFEASGYAIIRDGWDEQANYLLFDFGEIAHGVHKDATPSAAHGHADILSFELCLRGRPLVIDPGFHTYFGSLEWHRYFRATRGHNVVEVNGCGQAVHEGRISWSQVSSPTERIWLESELLHVAGAAIDRFAGLPEKVRHRREILFRKGKYVLVLDHLFGAEPRADFHIESSLHFSSAQFTADGNFVLDGRQPVMLAALPGGFHLDCQAGGAAADQGWMAEGYGKKQPISAARITGQSSLPVFMAMLFPLREFAPEELHLSLEALPESGCRCRVTLGGEQETVVWNPEQKPVEIDREAALQSDARWAICSANEKKREMYLVLPWQILVEQAPVETVGPGRPLAHIILREKQAPEISWPPART